MKVLSLKSFTCNSTFTQHKSGKNPFSWRITPGNIEGNFLFHKEVLRINWQAYYFTGRNSKDHVWDQLGRRITGRLLPLQTIQQLKNFFYRSGRDYPYATLIVYRLHLIVPCSLLISFFTYLATRIDRITINKTFPHKQFTSKIINCFEFCSL